MAEQDPDNVDTQLETSVLRQLSDDLRLQAWLAAAELRNPSANTESGRAEIEVLARARDEIRLQMHLGKLEAKEEFERLEGRWQTLMSLAERAVDDAGERLHDVMKDIREAYQKLRKR